MPSSVRLTVALLALTAVVLVTPVNAVRQQLPAGRVLPDFDIREGGAPQAPSPETEAEARRAAQAGAPRVRVQPFSGGGPGVVRAGVGVGCGGAGAAARS